MSRSHSIWVVLWYDIQTDKETVDSCFTVKGEMANYLRELSKKENLKNFRVISVRDNQPNLPIKEYNMSEIIGEEISE